MPLQGIKYNQVNKGMYSYSKIINHLFLCFVFLHLETRFSFFITYQATLLLKAIYLHIQEKHFPTRGWSWCK